MPSPRSMLAIAAMTGMVRDMTPDVARMRAAAGEGYATATDLADWLVRTLELPFREAHHVTGRIVAAGGGREGCPARAAARRHAGDREADHQGRLRRALGRQFGEKPRELRRHGAEKCPPGRRAVAQGAGQGGG